MDDGGFIDKSICGREGGAACGPFRLAAPAEEAYCEAAKDFGLRVLATGGADGRGWRGVDIR